MHTNLEGDYAAQAKRAGCWGELRPYEELRAHWEPAERFEERLIVTQVFESFLPEVPLEEKCDYAGCLRAAGWVWYRTKEEIKRGSTARFKLGERQQVCAQHKVEWRPWVALGAPRPAEVSAPAAKPKRLTVVKLPAPSLGRRKHACPTCTCR